MKERAITVVALLALFGILLFIGKSALLPAIAIIALMGLYEFYKVFKEKYNPMFIVGITCAIINFGFLIAGYNFLVYTTALLTLIALCGIVLRYKKYNILDAAVTIIGYVYVIYSFTFCFLLVEKFGNNLYFAWLLAAIAWGADTGGYLTGMLFGKTKLCEALSPKKTREGSLGGVCFSVILSIIVTLVYKSVILQYISYSFMFNPITISAFVIIIAVLSILSQIGDLVASSIKRHVNVKDYSNIMPGHGGILDRFDSIIFISPILYFIVEVAMLVLK